jgi:hypothetical protein
MEITTQQRVLIEDRVRLEIDDIVKRTLQQKMNISSVLARRRTTSQNYVYQDRKQQGAMNFNRACDLIYHVEMVRQTSLRIEAGVYKPAQTQTGLSPLAKEFIPKENQDKALVVQKTEAPSVKPKDTVRIVEVVDEEGKSVPEIKAERQLAVVPTKKNKTGKGEWKAKGLPPPVNKNLAIHKMELNRKKTEHLALEDVPNDQVIVAYPHDETVKCVGTDLRHTYTPKQMYVLRQADYRDALEHLLSESKDYTLDCQNKKYLSTTFAEWAAYLRLVVQKDMRAVFSTDPMLRYFFYRSTMEKRVEMFFCKEEFPKSPNQATHFGYVLYSDRLEGGKFQDIFSLVHHPIERITELETLCHMMFRIQQSLYMEDNKIIERSEKDYSLTPAQMAVLNLLRISQYKYNKVDHKQTVKQTGPMITMLSVVTSWAVSFEVESPYVEITMLNISSNTKKIDIVRNHEGTKTTFEVTQFIQDVAKFSYGDLRTIHKAIFTVTPDSRGPICVRVEILEIQSQPDV